MFDVVTGGAGFIGSHLVDTLVAQGNEVLVIDSLAAGQQGNNCPAYRCLQGPVPDRRTCWSDGWQDAIEGADRLFHLAADPDVRQSAANPDPTMQNNIMATYRVLEAMRLHNVPETGLHLHLHGLWGCDGHPDTRGLHPARTHLGLRRKQARLRGADLRVLPFVWHEGLELPLCQYHRGTERSRRDHGFHPETSRRTRPNWRSSATGNRPSPISRCMNVSRRCSMPPGKPGAR